MDTPSKRPKAKPAPCSPQIARMRVRIAARDASGRRLTYLILGPSMVRCAIGRGGLTRAKAEGDGATPIGRFAILQWRFQPTRPAFSRAGLAAVTIGRQDGWCDDPRSGAYNRPVRIPFAASHERMWRDDGKYAVVGVIDYNLTPCRRGAGSAIFFHICDEDFGPTAGCVALRARDLRKLLPRLARHTQIEIL